MHTSDEDVSFVCCSPPAKKNKEECNANRTGGNLSFSFLGTERERKREREREKPARYVRTHAARYTRCKQMSRRNGKRFQQDRFSANVADFVLERDVAVYPKGTAGLFDLVVLNPEIDTTFGRSVDCSVRLDQKEAAVDSTLVLGISRRHAKIFRRKQTWYICDTESTNGVYVNNLKIKKGKEHPLANGDVIVFGGGGTSKEGTKKKQTRSPFRYFFRKNSDKIGSANARVGGKRKRSDSVDEEKKVSSYTAEKSGKESTVRSVVGAASRSITKPSNSEGTNARVMLQMNETVTCAICLGILVKTLNLSCGHSCCSGCWEDWKGSRSACPICRADISSEPSRNRTVDQIVQVLVDSGGLPDDDVSEWRKKTEEETRKA